MARKTQIDRAIEKVDAEIAQLQAIRFRLVSAAQDDKPKRRAKSKLSVDVTELKGASGIVTSGTGT